MTQPPDKIPANVVSNPGLEETPLSSSITALSSELVQGLKLDLQGSAAEQVQQAMSELNVEDSNSIIF
ncbi:MAG: hypothetical protein ACXW3J_08905, partial [Methylocystis sp.]